MKKPISALLVYDQSNSLDGLKLALEGQFIRTSQARTCREAWHALSAANPPHLVFTGTTLPDGTWAEVLFLAARAPAFVNVIVVAGLPDVKFYVQVIERGAFDFIAPPFVAGELAHVVRCAADNVLSRRNARTRFERSGSHPLLSPLEPPSN